MAASLTQNALQVNFDLVLSPSDDGLVSMLKTLESSGLRGFLGCTAAINEEDLVAFFANGIMRENAVISSVQGMFVEITEELFAGSFDLPSEGLTSVNELPTDLINEARRAFSATGEPIKTSCKNKEMKIEFRLLNDILAKTVTTKAGSFDAVTHERFLLMTAIHGGIKINWSRVLFDILKEMVNPSSKQARGFAVQICILLKGAPNLTLGESKPFPPLKVLNVKTIGTYIAKNKSVSTATEKGKKEPVVETVVKAAVKRRPAPTAEPEETDEEETEKEEKDEEEKDKEETNVAEKEKEESNTNKFGCGIAFREVDWYKATLPQIDLAAKGKEEIKGNPCKEIFALISANVDFLVQIRDAVIEEIVSFFNSFSIRGLSALKSVSYLAAKEALLLNWAETDSLQTVVQRCLYITAKYREMLIRKFLEARRSNLVSGTPTSAIDLQVLDILSVAHRLALIKLVEQLKLHKLEWTRPSTSHLFGGAVDQSRGIHSQFYPNFSSTSWVRSLISIDGSWTVVEGVDPKPVRLERPIISKQRSRYRRGRLWMLLPQSAFSLNQSRTSILEDLTLQFFRGIGRKFVHMWFGFLFLDIYSQWVQLAIVEI
ncbi:hypothetical protein F511_30510 [Dorcoceras hygrometricum]|uniref:Dystroglycan-like n=1 Tax=Dorcoceras hygrometricum TaxID=472368 RepID=A0A2Z7BNW1_9LAMI|nr:hypothetical protein F511_30510 [Dorcoceras hygrometricum]